MKYNNNVAKLKSKEGMSLVEVIVVLVILALLAAIIVPTLVKYIDSSQEKVCHANMLILLRHYKTYLILMPDTSLSDYVTNNTDNLKCPAGGTYSVILNPVTHDEELFCSKHGSSTGNTYTPLPTTTATPKPDNRLIPSTTVEVNSTWPEDHEFFKEDGYSKPYDIFFGQTFYYSGNYYIVTHAKVDLYIEKGIPTPTNGWWKDNGLVRINNRVIVWDGGSTQDFNTLYKNNLPRQGDICYCKVNGEYGYYVFALANQTWIDPPSHSLTNWVKLGTYPLN